ncbi:MULTISPECIES: ABC transporter ATP-binding protein [unclassified Solwaraspora]|uniref:ABC transporter ATP-binding protein n=1 Tax=unclassified Solwaraspora TaxID=2627926 RepID=UPI00259AEAFF|nr:ABC transporter ATP-binding protein [Solwaraspora sp. WMMA2056]WJK42048.1 ABC transporter ATP-binding protein [Solwaraspora sp. WMMA2056]
MLSRSSVLRRSLSAHRGKLIAAGVLALVGVAGQLCQPLLIRRVLTALESGEPYGTAATLVLAVMVAGAGVGAAQQFLLQCTGEAVVFAARRALVVHLLRLPVSVYDGRESGDLIARVGSDTPLLRSMFASGVVDMVSGLLLVSGALIAMAIIDPLLLGVSLLPVLLGAVGVRFLSRRLAAVSGTVQETVGGLIAALARALGAVRTIRIAGATDSETAKVVECADQARRAGVRLAQVSAYIGPIVRLALQGAFVAVIGFGGLRVAQGAMQLGDLVAFLLFLFVLALPLAQVADAVTTIQSGRGALSRIQEILTLPDEKQVMPARSSTISPTWHPVPAIEFDDVSFGYHGDVVLRNVSFQIPEGSTTALVGPSGAGKSTILALIARLYEVSKGEIRLYGRDIREYPLDELRALLGYVEQEAPVLAGSVRDNLTLAAQEASDLEIDAVARAVNLDLLIARHPAGLQAPVGEGGGMLSGGERQRLAVARALLAKSPVLLFDEPTAHLDARNEQLLQDSLGTLAAGRTVLIVAHRLATVVRADRIVVIDEGRATAVGQHDDLLTNNELYREFAGRQLLI